MRSGQRGGDVGAGAEAGIDQPPLAQLVQGRFVEMRPTRLDDRLAIPPQAEPAQILEYALDELGPAAAGVEILDPQTEASARRARRQMTQRRRISMAKVQPARRRRREPANGHCCKSDS